MTAGRFNLTAEAGATLRLGLVFSTDTGEVDDDDAPIFEPYDFTDATIRMQIRDRPGGTLRADLSTSDGITVTGPGQVSVELTSAQTATLTRGRYDLIASYPSGDVRRLLEGTVTVHPRITEEATDGP